MIKNIRLLNSFRVKFLFSPVRDRFSFMSFVRSTSFRDVFSDTFFGMIHVTNIEKERDLKFNEKFKKMYICLIDSFVSRFCRKDLWVYACRRFFQQPRLFSNESSFFVYF